MPLVARTRTRASEGFMGTPSLRFKPGAVCHICSLRQLMSSAASGPARRLEGKTERPHLTARRRGWTTVTAPSNGREGNTSDDKSRWGHHPDFSGGFPFRF